MRPKLIDRPLTEDERQQLKVGLRSVKAFTLRRCQILLATAEGEPPSRIAGIVGCTRTTVSQVISDFNSRGSCVSMRSGDDRTLCEEVGPESRKSIRG
jgi:hypothetical protein